MTALKEQGETVAYVACGMTDVLALTTADVGISPLAAPPLISQLCSIGLPNREVQALVALLDMGTDNQAVSSPVELR